MKILLKTPFVNNNKYLPHLLEHCLLSPKNFQESHHYWEIDASVRTWYTEYEYDEDFPEKFLEILCRVPSKEQFLLEEKIIKKELRWVSFWQKYFEKILQKIYNAKTKVNTAISLSYQDLLNYHKKYYVQENMILIDRDWELIRSYWKGGKLKKYEKSDFDLEKIYTSALHYQGFKEYFLRTPIDSIENVLLLDFFSYFLEDYFLYIERKKAKYPSNYLSFYITDQNFIITREENCPKLNQKEVKVFFESFSQYFLQKIQENKKRIFIPHLALFRDVFVSVEDHLQILEQFSFDDMSLLLKKFKL